MLVEQLRVNGIQLPTYGLGSRKVACPRCSAQRRDKADPCLSVTIDDKGAVWKCHHCGWSGAENNGAPLDLANPQPAKPVAVKPLPPEAYAWFKGRCIGSDTLARAGVGWTSR